MLIVCPNCKKRYEMDPAKLPENMKFRCASCKAIFKLVRKAPPQAAPAAPAPEQPQAPSAAQPAQAQAPVQASAQPQAAAPVQAPRSGQVKVVVANESKAFCEAVRKVLAAEPFEVVVCNDGRVALETVESMRPDLLLLDVALPTMFGFEVCERVRQNPDLAHVKIVLIASIYDKTRYKRSPNSLYGADDYIEKHHIPDSLVPMVYRLTSGTMPASHLPSESELQSQETTRSELREAEVEETTAASAPQAQPAPVQPPPVAKEPSAEPQAAGGFGFSAGAESVALQEIVPFDEIAPMAAPVAAPQPAAPPQPSEAEVKAKRLARIIVSDIVLYNQGKVEQGVRDGNFYALLVDDIREGERLYRQRVPEDVREGTNFLREAFEDLITKKRAELRI